jgi:hypothetical protein
MPELPVNERIKSFIEVDQVLTEEAALGESNRCLSCCLTCYNPDSGFAEAPVAREKDRKLETAG